MTWVEHVDAEGQALVREHPANSGACDPDDPCDGCAVAFAEPEGETCRGCGLAAAVHNEEDAATCAEIW